MAKPNIWIFSLEPLPNRYTYHWHTHLPNMFTQQCGNEFNVIQIDGVQKVSQTTKGAFLNFSDTNYWKSSQLCAFLDHYNNGRVTPNDHIFFADAWNPAIIQVKYINELMHYNWTLHGIWHAGRYDSQDFLGRLTGRQQWATDAEHSIYESLDHNYFATDYHIDIFQQAHKESNFFDFDGEWFEIEQAKGKIVRNGLPMEYSEYILQDYSPMQKKDIILFPHRVAPEKQVEIFRDLAASRPQYDWIVCQDMNLSKDEYHKLLGESKIVFSCSLQETCGISIANEAPLCYAIPLAPDRLSYKEIFEDFMEFLYDSEWTADFNNYLLNKDRLLNRIDYIMTHYDDYLGVLADYRDNQMSNFFTFSTRYLTNKE
jgi:glycosyltransferase involved in cell wall biosynthesis